MHSKEATRENFTRDSHQNQLSEHYFLPNSYSSINHRPYQSIKSDICIDAAAFQSGSVLPATLALNESLIEGCKGDTKWWLCGAQEYRRRRQAGETPFPPSTTLQQTSEFKIPSTKGGPDINCRVFAPSNSRHAKGVLYHIHGGGWVLGSAAGQDLLLDHLVSQTDLIVISIDYRLAPEFPFPAASDDCYDVAEWLVHHSRQRWNCDLKFIAGESAGATLASLALIHLREMGMSSQIAGVVLNYGCFDLTNLPSVRALDPEKPLILSYEDVSRFLDAYLPGMSFEQRRDPKISPAYNDLRGLAPALFIVGTEDGLTDDTILMSGRWQLAGNDTVVKFISGAPHGFITFNSDNLAIVQQGWDLIVDFLRSKIADQS